MLVFRLFRWIIYVYGFARCKVRQGRTGTYPMLSVVLDYSEKAGAFRVVDVEAEELVYEVCVCR